MKRIICALASLLCLAAPALAQSPETNTTLDYLRVRNNLQIDGTISGAGAPTGAPKFTVVNVSSNFTALPGNIYNVDTTAGNVICTVSTAAGVGGQGFIVQTPNSYTNTNIVTFRPHSGQSINGNTHNDVYFLPLFTGTPQNGLIGGDQGEPASYQFVSDGTSNWQITGISDDYYAGSQVPLIVAPNLWQANQLPATAGGESLGAAGTGWSDIFTGPSSSAYMHWVLSGLTGIRTLTMPDRNVNLNTVGYPSAGAFSGTGGTIGGGGTVTITAAPATTTSVILVSPTGTANVLPPAVTTKNNGSFVVTGTATGTFDWAIIRP